jgi:hypothetical protein
MEDIVAVEPFVPMCDPEKAAVVGAQRKIHTNIEPAESVAIIPLKPLGCPKPHRPGKILANVRYRRVRQSIALRDAIEGEWMLRKAHVKRKQDEGSKRSEFEAASTRSSVRHSPACHGKGSLWLFDG